MREKVLFLVLIGLFLGLWLFAARNPPLHNEEATGVKSVSPAQFDELAKNPKAFILDVHTPEQAHIKGTDTFIPFDKIKENAGDLPENKSTPMLVYCRSGSMSKEASRTLIEMGYSNVYDLSGGTNDYYEY